MRTIRDAIEMRVRELATSHKSRLAQLLPSLDDQFVDRRTPEDIRARADAILARYGDAPIRSHVLTLARRQICQCSSAETCDAVTV